MREGLVFYHRDTEDTEKNNSDSVSSAVKLVRQQHQRPRAVNRNAGLPIHHSRSQRHYRPRTRVGIQKYDSADLREADLNALFDVAPDVKGFEITSVDDRLNPNAGAVKLTEMDAAVQSKGRAERRAGRGLQSHMSRGDLRLLLK